MEKEACDVIAPCEDHVDLRNARASTFAYLTSLQSIRLLLTTHEFDGVLCQ